MNITDSDADFALPGRGSGAYLVLQSGDRWSDVFRLSPPQDAVIGRASSGQIVLRSDQASRRHARLAWSQEGWQIEDLGSRNGTFVNGKRVGTNQLLSDGDVIQVAGFSIHFTRQIEGGGSLAEARRNREKKGEDQITDEQITMEMDAESITDRRRTSKYLHGGGGKGDPVGASGPLLKLAFRLARCDSVSDSVELVLDHLCEHIDVNVVGIYASEENAKATAQQKHDLPLLATRQTGSRSYRRPPDSLVATVSSDDGQAILARNVFGDQELAGENSRGEFDVESLILAPVRDQAGLLRGLIHLTATRDQPPLESEDLEFVVAAGEILAESLLSLAGEANA